MLLYLVLFPLVLLLLLGTFFIVKQQTAAVIERFGKFTSVRQSGLHIKIPVIDRVSGRVSLKVQQLDVVVETKTKDDVFVKLKVSVQFKVIKDKVYDAFYKLDFPQEQMNAYVFDVVRAEVPKMILDDVFEKKDASKYSVRRSCWSDSSFGRLCSCHRNGFHIGGLFVFDNFLLDSTAFLVVSSYDKR